MFRRFLGSQASIGGKLCFGDIQAEQLARDFGTPLYILDESDFRSKCKEFRSAAADAHVSYASKANSSLAVLAMARDEGLDVDAASLGEMEAALRGGFEPGQITLHGNNKSRKELERSLDIGVGRVVIDNLTEIESIASFEKPVSVMLRLAPGVDPDTHEAISTGQEDTKFGFNISDGSAARALQSVQSYKRLKLVGLHCHVGSQLMNSDAHVVAVERIAKFAREMKIEVQELCVGGGLGIRYLECDHPESIKEHSRRITDAVRAVFPESTTIGLEPGRALVGEAGTTLYTVGPIKRLAVRTYLSVDGGVAENPRPQLYGAVYTAMNASQLDEPHDTPFRVAGRHCETDTLIPETMLPASTAEGDLIAVQCTGAYNLSMASNYNRYPRPAMVVVGNGAPRIALERQSLDDLFRGEVLMP